MSVIFAILMIILACFCYVASKVFDINFDKTNDGEKRLIWCVISYALKSIGNMLCVIAALFLWFGWSWNNDKVSDVSLRDTAITTTDIPIDTIMVDSLFLEKADSLKQVKGTEKNKPKVVAETKDNEETTDVKPFITHVTLTCYNPEPSQCDGDPLVTASTAVIDLDKLKRGKLNWCAVSPDLKAYLPFGSVVEIEGHGIYIVKDLMADRIKHGIDILQDSSKPEFKYHNVKVTKIS